MPRSLTSRVSQASLTTMPNYSTFTWHTPRSGHQAEHLVGKARPGDDQDDAPIRLRAGFTWQLPTSEIFVPFATVIGRRYSADAMERMRVALREFERTETSVSERHVELPEGAELIVAETENP